MTVHLFYYLNKQLTLKCMQRRDWPDHRNNVDDRITKLLSYAS